MITYSRSLEF